MQMLLTAVLALLRRRRHPSTLPPPPCDTFKVLGAKPGNHESTTKTTPYGILVGPWAPWALFLSLDLL